MRKIAILGYYGHNNFGDDLIQHYLYEIFNDNNVLVNIYSDIDSYGLRQSSCIANGLKDKSYLDADIIIIGGGGIVEPSFWAFRDGGLDQLINCKKKIIFLNVDIYESISGFDLGKLRQLNAEWYVRNDMSYHILRGINIHAEVLPDIIFSRKEAESEEDYDNRLAAIDAENDCGKKLIFYPNHHAFEPYFYRTSTFDECLRYSMSIMNIAKFLDWMISFGWKITIAPAQTDTIVDDRIVGGMIFSFMQFKKQVKIIIEPLHYEAHLNLIKAQQLVISMRYHVSMAAVKYSIPCIDIIHHDKNKSAWEDIGFPNNQLVQMNNFRVDELIEAANYLKSNCGLSQSKCFEFSVRARTSWKTFVRKFKESVNTVIA